MRSSVDKSTTVRMLGGPLAPTSGSAAVVARLYGIQDRADQIARSPDVVGLSARGGDLCGSLSKGLRQRAALARTLLSDPEPSAIFPAASASHVTDGRGRLVFGLRVKSGKSGR
jgi:ABC-type multidrug transport system ATPase subunit